MPTYLHLFSTDTISGKHYFDGEPIIYSEVNLCVDPLEIDWMISYLRELAFKHNGLDGLQRFESSKGEILCFFSQVSQDELHEMREDGELNLDDFNRFEVFFETEPNL